MKEGGQGMEVIEKTRWEGDKTVGIERVRRRMKRGMNGGESEKKEKEGLEVCETGENTLP